MTSQKRLLILTLFLSLTLVIAACGNNGSAGQTNKPSETKSTTDTKTPTAEPETPAKQVEIRQVLDWFPQTTHGGHFAALEKGFYKEAGLDVTIEPGGPQVSSTQIVASGKAEFGITGGDVLLQAREEGIPLVAIAASLQDSPAALFFHKGQNIKTFSDLNGRNVTALLYAAYWQFLKNNYKLDKVQETNFTGQFANFLADKEAVIQGYLTSDIAYFKSQNVDVDYLEVTSSGYRPYMSVVFTTEKFAKEHPEVVKAYVEATVKGWDYYKDNAPEVNKAIAAANTSQTVDGLNAEAKEMQRFVYEGDAATHGVGYMSAERWNDTASKLFSVGVLKKEPDVSAVFDPSFLPAK